MIADEAHSSQTGSAALSLRRLLADADPEDVATGTVSADDQLARESAGSKDLNLTYVALTATPKAKTLRLFGSKHGDGDDVSYLAFDTYPPLSNDSLKIRRPEGGGNTIRSNRRDWLARTSLTLCTSSCRLATSSVSS